MNKELSSFAQGLRIPVQGWDVIRRTPSLWPWLMIPWIIDIALIVVGWTTGLGYIQGWITALIAGWVGTGVWFNVLYYPILLVFGLIFVVIWLIAVMSVATVFAAPFNAILAEKTLRLRGVSVVATKGFGGWIWHNLKMVLIGIIKGTIFAMAGLILFSVSFIPGLNFLAAYLSMCLFAADVFDYGFEAKGLNLRQRAKTLSQGKTRVLGLGLGLSLTSVIPGLTVLLLPVSVVGAAWQMEKSE